MLSEQYQGTLPKVASTSSTILTHLYPMTPIELGEGFVIGKEKVDDKRADVVKCAWDAAEERMEELDERTEPLGECLKSQANTDKYLQFFLPVWTSKAIHESIE